MVFSFFGGFMGREAHNAKTTMIRRSKTSVFVFVSNGLIIAGLIDGQVKYVKKKTVKNYLVLVSRNGQGSYGNRVSFTSGERDGGITVNKGHTLICIC